MILLRTLHKDIARYNQVSYLLSFEIESVLYRFTQSQRINKLSSMIIDLIFRLILERMLKRNLDGNWSMEIYSVLQGKE